MDRPDDSGRTVKETRVECGWSKSTTRRLVRRAVGPQPARMARLLVTLALSLVQDIRPEHREVSIGHDTDRHHHEASVAPEVATFVEIAIKMEDKEQMVEEGCQHCCAPWRVHMPFCFLPRRGGSSSFGRGGRI